MANSKTSLNGYEYGRNPKTTAPFWAGSGEGAEIDDTGTYTDKTWSSKKISDELAEKADKTELASYAKATSVYTKSESYSKAEVDNLISDIPAVDAYTKSQTDDLLANKANAADVYTKSQTYTKTEVDNLISGIPAVDAYTKTQTDALLANKANAADVYTKTEADSLLAGKADVTDLADYAKSTAVYTKSQTYTKTEVDTLLANIPTPDMSNYYTKSQTYSKTETDSKILKQLYGDDNWAGDDKAQNLVIINPQGDYPDILAIDRTDGTQTVVTSIATAHALADKADASDVYTKNQTYTKTEVDNLISGGGGGDKVYTYTVTKTSDTYSNVLLAATNAFRLAVAGEDACKLKEIICKTKKYFNSMDDVTRYRYKVTKISVVYRHSSPTSPASTIRFEAEATQYNNQAGMGQSNYGIEVYSTTAGSSDSHAYFKENSFQANSSTGAITNSTWDYSSDSVDNDPWNISSGSNDTGEIEFVYG